MTETIAKKRGRPKKTSPDSSAPPPSSKLSTSEVVKPIPATTTIKTRPKSSTAKKVTTKVASKASAANSTKVITSTIASAIASASAPATEKLETVAIPEKPAAQPEINSAETQLGASGNLLLETNTNMAGNSSSGTRPSPTSPTNTTSISSSPILSQVHQIQTMRSASTTPKTSSQSPKPTSKPTPIQTKPTSSKSLPLKGLNQSITSRLTTPAGARPSVGKGERPLPANYQSVARRVTMTIVALPILLVTSWVLWDRLVLGQEKKSLIREPPVVPGPPMAAEMETWNKRE